MRVAIFLLTAAAVMAAATLLQRLHAQSSLHDKSSHHCCSSCTPNNQIMHSSLISRTCNQRKHHHHYRELRSKVMESNGRVMNCPPTSVSITFATDGSEKGKIINLVTDMVHKIFILRPYIIDGRYRPTTEWQNSEMTSTMLGEFTAMKEAIEYIFALRYRLRMIGIRVEGPAYIFGDNQSVLGSVLKKKCAAAYHLVREGVARGEWITAYINTHATSLICLRNQCLQERGGMVLSRRYYNTFSV
eukprot:scaffold4397_cov165-Skeletonema_dohrnii-CCMP3373.AAC.2